MSLRLHFHFLGNLFLVSLLGTAYLQARFYQTNCALWSSYYVNYIYISNDDREIMLELQNGDTIIVPFNIGFKEFQVTTGRGFEQTYVYDGKNLVRTKHRECTDSI